jgi:hypothetical protein
VTLDYHKVRLFIKRACCPSSSSDLPTTLAQNETTKTKTLATMPSTNLITLVCLSVLATSSVAHSPPPPPGHIPVPFGTPINSGAPHIPTGVFPTGVFPTGAFPTDTMPHGHPHIPHPAIGRPEEESDHEKRFEGPRHQGRPAEWHHYNPNAEEEKPSRWVGPPPPPPFATVGPRPTGAQDFPTAGPTAGGPWAGRPTGF